VTQNERLRALLKEARVLHGCHGVCVPECIWSRIDAVLAEPQEECRDCMNNMNIARLETKRANRQNDLLYAEEQRRIAVMAERDEARAEIERLKAALDCPCSDYALPTHRCVRCDQEVKP
jgi:hypothetical protein